ncbi:hypothetical protein QR680_006406 [Steinernema hermaphroditum]|uniref:Uncharacterized protein n=1 Tax=Steinernema hermaphroditum TaxID=289476 RepID=A0AA39HVB6_9BILA|nr:hypothetical protein QR680_006406 [Steinernema hermaphroditum]
MLMRVALLCLLLLATASAMVPMMAGKMPDINKQRPFSTLPIKGVKIPISGYRYRTSRGQVEAYGPLYRVDSPVGSFYSFRILNGAVLF